MTAPTRVGEVVRGRWFPSDVLLPGESRAWHNVYTMVTESALVVFRRVSEVPDWESVIEWGATALPTTDQGARKGFDVHTQNGLAVVTLGSGCRCGRLGKWSGPSWARYERSNG